MARYSKVSIPADLFEELKKVHEEGGFHGMGFPSPSAVVVHATRKAVADAKGAA